MEGRGLAIELLGASLRLQALTGNVSRRAVTLCGAPMGRHKFGKELLPHTLGIGEAARLRSQEVPDG